MLLSIMHDNISLNIFSFFNGNTAKDIRKTV